MDLTERQLSKIKFSQQPNTIVFPAYTSEMLIAILTSYLNGLGQKSNIIDPKAIELCARKVASMTGDVRRALDIASQMIANLGFYFYLFYYFQLFYILVMIWTIQMMLWKKLIRIKLF